jgi:hypothetical protein
MRGPQSGRGLGSILGLEEVKAWRGTKKTGNFSRDVASAQFLNRIQKKSILKHKVSKPCENIEKVTQVSVKIEFMSTFRKKYGKI